MESFTLLHKQYRDSFFFVLLLEAIPKTSPPNLVTDPFNQKPHPQQPTSPCLHPTSTTTTRGCPEDVLVLQ